MTLADKLSCLPIAWDISQEAAERVIAEPEMSSTWRACSPVFPLTISTGRCGRACQWLGRCCDRSLLHEQHGILMPTGGGTRTSSINWGQRQRPLLPDPPQSSSRDCSRRGVGKGAETAPSLRTGTGGRRHWGDWADVSRKGCRYGEKRGPPWARSTAHTVAKHL